MATGAYSFLDIAVLDDVRSRLAAGDALVILAADLDEVIWANGPGARLFGFPDIEAIMGATAGLGSVARRQIASISGFPAIGDDRPVAVRIASGMSSRIVTFQASGITLPDGEPALLLCEPATLAKSLSATERAARAIEGFTEEGHLAAIIDASGQVVAARDGFEDVGLDHKTLADLVAEVAGEQDRLVKRMVTCGKGRIPAGMARLADDPALHLLIVVDDAEAEQETPSLTSDETPASEAGRPAETTDMPAADEPAREEEVQKAPAGKTAAGDARGSEDNWYFNGDRHARPEKAGEKVAAADTPSAEEASPVDEDRIAAVRESGPVRFVWRTDEEGRFSSLSPEFVDAVGPNATDVVGRKFVDVALTFGLDPTGEIAGLLARRDTWSGRSVFWPIEGTDLKVPVDLAALPVYGRDRAFEGFRGFGVARMADAIVDPEELGLFLSPSGGKTVPATREPDADDAEADPFHGEVPALSVVPQPDRRFTDKVIRLAEHRPQPAARQLSPGEHSAFEEIANRLKRDSAETEAPEDGPSEGALPSHDPESTRDDDLPTDEKRAGEDDEGVVAPSAGASEDVETASSGTDENREATPGYVDETLDGAPSDRREPLDASSHDADDPAGAAEGDSDEPTEMAKADFSVEADDRTASDADETQDDARRDAEQASEDASAAAETAARDEPSEPSPSTIVPAAFALPLDRAGKDGLDVDVLDRLPVPLLVHAGDDLHFANRELLDLTGYASLDALADAGGLGALFDEPYEDPDSGERRLCLRTRDGDEMPVEALLQSIPWNRGTALLLSLRTEPRTRSAGRDDAAETMAPAPAIALDTETVNQLQARLDELRTIIDTATDGVIIISSDGAIRSISRPAEALFGYDADELAGKPFASLFAIESQRAARDYLAGLSDNGVASILNDGREVIGREAQGRFIPLFMTIGRLPGQGGFCAVVRDITQWKRAEEELTQARAQAEYASSQKTEFLARVSHEIRTPLNAIIGFSELMIDEKFGPLGNERYRDYLRDINRSGNHVLDLVNDLLDISKIEAGQQELSFEAVSLNDTLGETVAMMQPQANRDRVIIRSSFPSRLPEVVADLRSIRQIALNLLSNAVRYTPAGGQVIVSTSYEASGDIVMRIRDTGIGMSAAEIEQAMKPFKQLNTLKRARGDGTGLGLPLTKALVEANRARFTIGSVPGEGTLVEITFPSTRVLAE